MADLLAWMRRAYPALAVRMSIDISDSLFQQVQTGDLDRAVLHRPPPRADLVMELVAEEKLIMVTADPHGRVHPPDYVYVDWGSPYAESHAAAFPDLSHAAVQVSLGSLALSLVLSAGGTGYFRSAIARPYLSDGRLRRAPDTPEFSHSIYAVYSRRGDRGRIDRLRAGLRACGSAEVRP